jgi:hypothetical protein
MSQPTFTITINGIKTATVNGIADAVKQIDWTLKGELEGQTFELPQTTLIPDPVEAGFIPLSALTPEVVTTWINEHEDRMFAIKAHIQYVLNKQVAEAGLTTTPMPWAPAPEVVPTTPLETPAPV